MASSGNAAAQREVARVTSYFSSIHAAFSRSPSFWNIRFVMNGDVDYGPRLHGCQLYRLCPGHQQCIALIIESGGELMVLDLCSSAELSSVELRLAQSWRP